MSGSVTVRYRPAPPQQGHGSVPEELDDPGLPDDAFPDDGDELPGLPGEDAARRRRYDVSRRVRERLAAHVASADPLHLGDIYRPEDVLPVDLAERARHFQAQAPEYAKDFILTSMHQMLLMRMPMDLIARRLGIGVRQAYNYKKELRRRVAEEARRLDPYPLIGESLAHYRMIISEGWAMAKRQGATPGEKKAGLDIAMKAQGEYWKLMQLGGAMERNLLREGMEEQIEKRNGHENANGTVSLQNMMRDFVSTRPRLSHLPGPEIGDRIIEEDGETPEDEEGEGMIDGVAEEVSHGEHSDGDDYGTFIL